MREELLALFLVALFLGTGVSVAQGQPSSTCSFGNAERSLNANNVNARLFNVGMLFWKGRGFSYTVPKASSISAIFSQSILVGGMVDGKLRLAATNYGPYEFWPGPLQGNTANPPADCSQYDHIYKVSQADINRYNATGEATDDLTDWPAHLGAPVVDGDGIQDNYDLQGGDRPEMIGDQTLWWVMNDAAGAHEYTMTEALGIEVQVTAYALESGDALNNTTFYRFKLVYQGSAPLRKAYFGLFTDVDLGGARDDYVGSDSVRNMGFAYNADDNDGWYGSPPPAVGVVVLDGPPAVTDGLDNDGDGSVDEEGEYIGLTNFIAPNKIAIYDNGGKRDFYDYMRSRWSDGYHLTIGGELGRDTTCGASPDAPDDDGGGATGHGECIPTDFAFAGDPVESRFWSMENIDGEGTQATPTDRRFVTASGAFTMQPGDELEFTYAIVWSQGLSRLHSVASLQEDVDLVHAFHRGTYSPVPPSSRPSEAPMPMSPAHGAVQQDSSFQWTTIQPNTYYRLQVSQEPTFSSLRVNQFIHPIDRSQYALPRSLEPGRLWYWRIRAENTSGAGPWSEVQMFSVADGPLPGVLEVERSYPNPSSGNTTLVFDLPAISTVRVEVFDILGRSVLAASARMLPAGPARQWQVDTSGLSAGIYFYRVIAESGQRVWQDTGRMTVVRQR